MIVIEWLLIRVLPIALVIGGVAYGYHNHKQSLIEAGRQEERARWVDKERQAASRTAAMLAEQRKRVDELREIHNIEIAKIQNQHEKHTQKLNTDINSLSKRGLYVVATKCESDRDGMPESGSDTGDPSSEPDRVRLHTQDEQNLIALAQDAQDVVNKYEAARSLILSRPDCFSVVK